MKPDITFTAPGANTIKNDDLFGNDKRSTVMHYGL